MRDKEEMTAQRDQLMERMSDLIEAKIYLDQELEHVHDMVDDIREKGANPKDPRHTALSITPLGDDLQQISSVLESLRNKASTPADWSNEWYEQCQKLKKEVKVLKQKVLDRLLDMIRFIMNCLVNIILFEIKWTCYLSSIGCSINECHLTLICLAHVEIIKIEINLFYLKF